jgi:hypothetical protein
MKGCLEGGSSKKPSGNETEKAKKIVRDKFKCPNCEELGHRKNNPKYPFNGTKKASSFTVVMSCPPCLYCCAGICS